MPGIDKGWTLNHLRYAKNSFLLALTGQRLLNSNAIEELRDRRVMMRQDAIIYDPDQSEFVGLGEKFTLEFNSIISAKVNDNINYLVDLNQFYQFARRNLIKESFEYAKAYAEHNGLEASFKAQSWYQYVRMVRNAISHNLHFNFNKGDLKKLPVSHYGRTITRSEDGVEIEDTFINPQTTIFILIDLIDFVQNN